MIDVKLEMFDLEIRDALSVDVFYEKIGDLKPTHTVQFGVTTYSIQLLLHRVKAKIAATLVN